MSLLIAPTVSRRLLRLVAAALTTLLLSSCGFFYPQTVEFYDPECQILAKKVELRSVSIRGVGLSCHNEGCLIALIPAAASAIVSGSIVVVGNVVYWLEKQGKCATMDWSNDNDQSNW
ncbi:hypothetical protein [Motiliproteus sp. MSK22-1]|uniref:hypothetical protein n=1 Tax=Motiliproteus sp. MSK22-1 TaxID=1897630 RepID=UPI000977FFEF|nr:hypothetical protein [Motiliproteus sp. MSK22-1]OMH25276.1 hypothetical protein BGP75_26110 [Motiliproteus sp. MSK22-1]